MGSPSTAASAPLHRDLVEDILVKLPVKSLLRFKAASKRLNSLISSPNFITRHHQSSKGRPPSSSIVLARGIILRCSNLGTSDAPPLLERLDPAWDYLGCPLKVCKVMGYANGLYCFETIYKAEPDFVYILWNPATKQYAHVPFRWELAIGFGYHSGIQDYKLFGISSFGSPLVFSLKRGIWREIQSPDRSLKNYWLKYYWQKQESGALVVNGVWYGATNDYKRRLGILSFDLREDSLAWIDSPLPPGSYNTDYSVQLGLYHEKLCLFVADSQSQSPTGYCRLDMWVMEGKASWTKMFATDLSTSDIPVGKYLTLGPSLQGGRVLLNANAELVSKLFLYDLSTDRWKEIAKENYLEEGVDEAYDYVESLVSPDVVSCHGELCNSVN